METSITIHTLIRKKGDDAGHLRVISTAPIQNTVTRGNEDPDESGKIMRNTRRPDTAPSLTAIGQQPHVMCIKNDQGTKSHLQIKICMYPPRNSKVISHRKFYSRG